MNKSESIDKLAAALHSAQDRLKYAKKDSSNPFFKSKYADLESVWDACRDALRDNGLAVSQLPINEGEMVGVETILMHISGQYISNSCSVRTVKPDPQSAGSAITYLRRYGLAAVLGIIQSDDDANESSGKVVSHSLDAKQVKKEVDQSLNLNVRTPVYDENKPYVATIGKHKGKVLKDINKDELRLHQSEILDWMKTNPNLSGVNKKLAEQLMLEIDKVL